MAEEVNNQINIYVQSGDAQAQYDALAAKNLTLQQSVENLRIKQAQADAERKAGNAAAEASYKSLGEQISQAQKRLDDNTAAMERQAKKVSGELSPSIRDLEANVRTLTAAIKAGSEGDPGYDHKVQQLKLYNAALTEARISSGLMAEKMKEGKEHGEGFMEVLKGVAGGMGFVTSAEAGLEKGIDFLKESVQETVNLELGQKRLATAVKNWGNTSEGALERFNEKAEELSKKFGYLYTPELTKVQEKLVTFGRLSEDQINQLLPVIVNFAAQTGKSMDEATQGILSAFEGNGRAMKQYGIELKKDEGFAVNYGIVMDQLASKVDGAAQVFQDSAAGALATYSKNIKELQEDIGKELLPLLGAFAKGGLSAVNALRQLPEFVENNKKAIIALVGAYALYNSALIANTLTKGYNSAATLYNTVVERGAAAAKWIATAANGALQLSYGILTGEITLATAATRAYQLVSAAAGGGLTLMIGALVAVGTAIAAYTSKISEAAEIEKTVSDVRAEAAKSVAKEKVDLELLLEVAKNEKKTKEERLKAIQQLNEISPEYLGNLTEENISTKEGTALITKYIEALNKKALAEAIHNKLVDLNKQKIEQQTKSQAELLHWYDYLGSAAAHTAQTAVENRNKEIQAIDAQILALNKLATAQDEAGEKENPDNKKDKERESITKFFSDARKARADFDALTKSSDEAEVNRVQEHIHTLSDKLEEYRHNGLITLGEYYEAKKLLEKNDAYQELEDQAKRAEAEAKKAAEQRKKRLEEFKKLQEDLLAESQLALNKTLSADAKELADLAVKYDKQKAELKKFLDDKTISQKEYSKTLLQIEENQQNEEKAIRAKQEKASKTKQYEEDLKAQQVLFAKVKELQQDRLNQGLITQSEYDRRIGQLEVAEFEYKRELAKKYKGIVDKAADDEVKADQDAKTQKSKNDQDELKRIQANLDYIKQKRKQQLAAEKDDYTNSTEARLQIIAEEYTKEYALYKDNAEALKALNAATAAQIAKVYEDQWKKTLTTIATDTQQMATTVMGIASNIAKVQDNHANAEIAAEKKKNAAIIASYEAQVKNKQLTREKADKLEAAANEEMAKKDDDLKRRQFERDKKMKMATAAINMAVGIMNAFATAPNFIVGAVEAALVLAAGIAEEAAIGSEQYTSMADGGMLGGDAHSDPSGGNRVVDGYGRTIHKVERGEYVVPKDATANNPDVIRMLTTQGRNRNIKDLLAPSTPINSERASDTIQQANSGWQTTAAGTRSTRSASGTSLDTSKMEQLLQKNNDLHSENIQLQKKIAAKPTLSLSALHESEHTQQYMIKGQL